MGDISERESTLSTQPTGGTTGGNADSYTGTDTTYQTLATWTVGASNIGVLKEVAFTIDSNGHAQYQLTIDGTTFFTDWQPDADVALPFPNNVISSSGTVLLEVKSDDGTSITVYGSITGGEL